MPNRRSKAYSLTLQVITLKLSLSPPEFWVSKPQLLCPKTPQNLKFKPQRDMEAMLFFMIDTRRIEKRSQKNTLKNLA